jgi:ribose 5-phosphate isomerase B
MRRLAVAADHAGAPLRDELVRRLAHIAADWEPLDLGGGAPGDDYPDAALAVARAVVSGEAERGLLLCGSGIGVAIVANKLAGIRAAVVHDPASARTGVVDDGMNVLAMGGRLIDPEHALEVLGAFLAAVPSDEERHRRRRAKIAAIESGTDPRRG